MFSWNKEKKRPSVLKQGLFHERVVDTIIQDLDDLVNGQRLSNRNHTNLHIFYDKWALEDTFKKNAIS